MAKEVVSRSRKQTAARRCRDPFVALEDTIEEIIGLSQVRFDGLDEGVETTEELPETG
jgi:predicted transcriptional regulator